MAARRPARATTKPARMFLSADVDFSAGRLLLEMALQAQDVIALGEHPRVDRPMGLVASRATLPHSFVFEDKRTALRNVAFTAGFLLRGKSRAPTDNCGPLVRIVTIATTDSSSC